MKLIVACVLALEIIRVAGADADSAAREIEVTGRASFGYGAIDGFVQTPAGGTPGTSSQRRPTLHELDLDDGGFYDAQVDLRWRDLCAWVGYQALDL